MPKAEKAEKPEKAVKATRSPKSKGDKVKRAPSAYIIFSTEVRPKVKADNPDATFGEMGKLLGAKWAAMTESEKSVRVVVLTVVSNEVSNCHFCLRSLT